MSKPIILGCVFEKMVGIVKQNYRFPEREIFVKILNLFSPYLSRTFYIQKLFLWITSSINRMQYKLPKQRSWCTSPNSHNFFLLQDVFFSFQESFAWHFLLYYLKWFLLILKIQVLPWIQNNFLYQKTFLPQLFLDLK